MYKNNMALPEYSMTAGSTKEFYIPIYNPSGRRIDASGMTARYVIADFVNQNCRPYVVKDCSVVAQEGDTAASLFVTLDAEDTVNLYGKFIYQVTATAASGEIGPMRGILNISPNNDKSAIL